jgi:hypothetical protein
MQSKSVRFRAAPIAPGGIESLIDQAGTELLPRRVAAAGGVIP